MELFIHHMIIDLKTDNFLSRRQDTGQGPRSQNAYTMPLVSQLTKNIASQSF